MKDHIKQYKKKLGEAMCEWMDMPASERSSSTIKSMIECWDKLSEMESKMSHSDGYGGDSWTADDAKNWNEHMKNSDGTMGGHWTIDQTNDLAASLGVEFTHVPAWCWNVICNMVYSDYGSVASSYGVSSPSFFGDLAKAFLFDKDGPDPDKKSSAYYNCIVKPNTP